MDAETERVMAVWRLDAETERVMAAWRLDGREGIARILARESIDYTTRVVYALCTELFNTRSEREELENELKSIHKFGG